MRSYDFENHFYAGEVLECLRARKEYPFMDADGNIHISDGMTTIGGICPSVNATKGFYNDDLVDIADGRISVMNEAGLQCGIISTSDGIELLPKDEAVRLSRITNDIVAEAVKKYPGRFLGSFCLPTPYVEESIEEMERAVKILGLQYWHTHSCYGHTHLGEEKYEPLFAKLAELDVPFYIHPTYTSEPYLLELGIGFATAPYGFGADVMKTSILLIRNGIFDRYPNLKMILGHMGESYPYIVDRMDKMIGLLKTFDPTVKAEKTVTEYFRNHNIFIAISGIFDSDVVDFAIKKFGIDSILYGSDYPYENLKKSVDFVRSLPISDEDKEKIFYKNAEKYILKI